MNALPEVRERMRLLEERLEHGFALIDQQREAGDTSREASKWERRWLALLAEYEGVCEELLAKGGTFTTPAPLPAPETSQQGSIGIEPEAERPTLRQPDGYGGAGRQKRARGPKASDTT